MPERYDLVVVGGGIGGIAAAKQAAGHGARCALIEPGALGGTCVNRGCVPKKVMWYAAETARTLEAAAAYGFALGPVGFDWGHIKRARDAYVRRLNVVYENSLLASGVALLRGRARLLDAHAVDVDGRPLEADHVIIATGGRPAVPGIPGAALGITSDGFFELEALPGRVLVVGAGYIAAELAGVLNSLGSRVAVVMRREALLDGFDPMLREGLMEEMERDGVAFHTNAQLQGLVRGGDGRLTADCGDGLRLEGLDTVIWAVGRLPNSEGLGLEAAGVAVDGQGYIRTDDFQNTTAPGVYAVGDITGRRQLTPVAIAAGRRLADRLFGGMPDRHLDYACIPSVVFTHPPVATVGMTEDEARERHGDAVKVYHTRFRPLYHAAVDSPRYTAMKLVTLGKEERGLGCPLIGEAVDEMLQGFAVAVTMGATKRQFDDTVAIHPTSAEELVTLR